jgi:hypothetical protein
MAVRQAGNIRKYPASIRLRRFPMTAVAAKRRFAAPSFIVDIFKNIAKQECQSRSGI